MSEPKFKTGDKVEVLFFENTCHKRNRDNYSYWRGNCPNAFPAIIRHMSERNPDTPNGMLYAVEFRKEDAGQILNILSKNPEPDSKLHTCNGYVKDIYGRWILEDAMRPYIEPPPTVVSTTSRLKTLLAVCQNKKTKQEAEAI